ncbi:hypothetical protein [Sinomonas susongensis]|uniref:hypothetical protein n=1 Tax=Sinomonas susongensis TaxID=1324851 RepID=UPI001108F6E7|nr:hypothetical protein [Sinomonas susongensis]
MLLVLATASTSAADPGHAADAGRTAPSAVAQSPITPSAPGNSPAVPGMQPAAPGASQTPPAAPPAPGDPMTWVFIVFGVLGVALLIGWAVLARRAADGEPEDSAGGDKAV